MNSTDKKLLRNATGKEFYSEWVKDIAKVSKIVIKNRLDIIKFGNFAKA